MAVVAVLPVVGVELLAEVVKHMHVIVLTTWYMAVMLVVGLHLVVLSVCLKLLMDH